LRVMLLYVGSFFFFSSRRRHTRFSRDWSSDVCSSDLFTATDTTSGAIKLRDGVATLTVGNTVSADAPGFTPAITGVTGPADITRSEERRVGKECRSRGAADREKKKKRVKR